MKLVLIALIALTVSANLQYKDFVNPIISAVNSNPRATWKAGINENFEGMTLDQIKYMCGTLLETPSWMKLPEQQITPLQDLPENFDSRTNWPHCTSIQEVRDQSNCGSCWAFASVEAISDRYCVKTGDANIRISSEDLLSCCGFTCGFGCNGGYPSAAWGYWARSGLVSGDKFGDNSYCQPYSLKPCDHHVNGTYGPCSGDSPTPACKKTCVNKDDYNTQKKQYKGSRSYSISSNVQAIQTEIHTNGPVGASFTVYEDFLTYKSGVYHHTTGSALGGHAIKLIGWGVENGTPYWLATNSWNEGWGDKGFFKIRRGNNECGIEGGIVAGLP